jgi:hypothetical protein
MGRRFLPALAVAAAAIAYGASPALAATQACHKAPPPPSSVNVYVEQVPTSGACPKKTHHVATVQPTYTQPTYTQPTYTQPVKVTPHHPTHKIQRHKKATPTVRPLPPTVYASAPHSPPPSAVSAAFDLGFGPTALFAGLLAVAALLALGGGLQHRGRR